jgi:hypothetical protein
LGHQPLVPLILLGLPFFPIILFGSTTLLTGMTGISLHMQWPLTSKAHGSFSQREQLVFGYGSNSMPKLFHYTFQRQTSRVDFVKLFRPNFPVSSI